MYNDRKVRNVLFLFCGLICYLGLISALFITYLNIFYSKYPETFISVLIIPIYILFLSLGTYFFIYYKQKRTFQIKYLIAFILIPVIIYTITWGNSRLSYFISLLLAILGIVILIFLLQISLRKK